MSRKPRTLKEMRADPRVAFVFYQKGEKTPWSVWLKNGWHLDESVLFHCRTIKQCLERLCQVEDTLMKYSWSKSNKKKFSC
tara:strand:+ start:246 stop:488 length:243 start_codon:yes stop_codon:yes gene_type:complete